MKKFLASVGDAQLLGQNGEHIADVHTLTESSLSFSTTMEDVRAGTAAKLYGRFSHTTSMTVTLTDAMFDMNYIAYQVGDINTVAGDEFPGEIGGKIFETESDPAKKNGTNFEITLQNTPINMGDANGLNKTVLWFKRPDTGNKAYKWHSVILNSGTTGWTPADKKYIIDSTIYTDFQGMENGDAVCVRYFRHAGNAKTVKIKADFFPAEMVLLLTTKLYAGESANIETGKPIGHVTVKIPRFQLDGSFDLSMAMTSAASVSLSGSALAVADGTCNESGVYAEIVEYVEADDEYADATGMVFVSPKGKYTTAGTTPGVAVYSVGEILQVYAKFEDGYGIVPASHYTFVNTTALGNVLYTADDTATNHKKGEMKATTSGAEVQILLGNQTTPVRINYISVEA